MKFIDFLLESSGGDGNYKTEINLEKAAQIFKNKCKNMNIDEPFWRGMRSKETYILEGQSSKRESISETNFHNIVIDDNVAYHAEKYPFRQKSIIGITNKGNKYAKVFGPELYAIYPYDEVIIGYCNRPDILYINLHNKILNKSIALSALNLNLYRLSGFNKETKSVKNLIDSIYEHKDSNKSLFTRIFGDFDIDKQEATKIIKEYYSLDNFIFDTSKANFNEKDIGEIWIGGKCLAIHVDKLEEFKELLK